MSKATNSLPTYTRGEERMNMITHIVGGGIAVLIWVAAILVAAQSGSALAVVSAALYGLSMVTVYTISSVYHGLRRNRGKAVLRVLDHCMIYFLIAGTCTPILLCSILPIAPYSAIALLSLVWGLTALAVTLTAVNMQRYKLFSMLCYIGIGWCILLDIPSTLTALGTTGFSFLLAGGIAYSIGAVLYGLGKKVHYMHAVFHLFVIAGSILQAICILFFVL